MEPDTITTVTPESLEAIRQQQEQRAEQAREASQRIRDIRAEGRSDRGLVTAVVDGSALLVDLEFATGASSSPAILGALVKQAHDRAVEDWNRQVNQITEDTLADQPELRETIRQTSARDLAAHTGHAEDDGDGADGAGPRPGAR